MLRVVKNACFFWSLRRNNGNVKQHSSNQSYLNHQQLIHIFTSQTAKEIWNLSTLRSFLGMWIWLVTFVADKNRTQNYTHRRRQCQLRNCSTQPLSHLQRLKYHQHQIFLSSYILLRTKVCVSFILCVFIVLSCHVHKFNVPSANIICETLNSVIS